MLFNSPIFIFGFIPCALLGFFLIARLNSRAALVWLTVASLFFYAWWDPKWLPLLLASIGFNFLVGRELAAKVQSLGPVRLPWVSAKALLVLAIVANVAVLVYYKYAAFLLNNLAVLLHTDWSVQAGELPLGISFFTFTQIAFLVDAYQHKAVDLSLARYGLFVTYYPHLIAGPILHHKEMMPQFALPDVFRFDANRLAEGLTIFVLGLFKKAVLADQFALYANTGFNGSLENPISLYASWGAALSYTLQLYFDFSGYSDMAIGLALMIGIRLPLNFHSPYKSLNVTDFWRRWHMTLSRFLRDYLYIPLGGNRNGRLRRYANLMATMVLGGLWHGAGWTFIVWGALHGFLLCAHTAWLHIRESLGWKPPAALRRPLQSLAWALTFFSVVVGWVFFRAENIDSAMAMLAGMAGQHGALLPDQLLAMAPWLRHIADGAGSVNFLADGTVMGFIEMLVLLAVGMVLVLATPTLHELSPRTRYLLLIPCAALALQRVLYGTSSQFLYFQF